MSDAPGLPAFRTRHLARRVLATALGVGALAVFLEATARVTVFGMAGIDPRHIAEIPRPRELVTLDTTPAIGFEYKPNLDRQLLMTGFRTNEWGMRDRDYERGKRPGVFRVAVIGSSHALPSGVEIEDAYHSLLEERLSRELGPVRYEFLNFAVGLHLPSQYVAMIQTRALQFAPDLILVSASPMAVPFFFTKWQRSASPNVVNRTPIEFRCTFLALARFRLGLDRRQIPAPKRIGSGKRSVIGKLAEISRSSRTPIVITRLGYDAGPPSPLELRLEDEARAKGMHYVDTRPAFAGKDPRDHRVHELDPHSNAAAHAIFADVIGDFLRREGLLGPRARVGPARLLRSD